MAGNTSDLRRQAEGRAKAAKDARDRVYRNKQSTKQQKDSADASVDAANAEVETWKSRERSSQSGCAPSLF